MVETDGFVADLAGLEGIRPLIIKEGTRPLRGLPYPTL